MTAVEFLIDQLFPKVLTAEQYYHIEQAKEMEKQQQGYSKEDMVKFAEFVATYPDKNRNPNGEMLHAKSKYDGAERTIDLLQIWFEQLKKYKMNKEFIPYEQALALKELGFDEPCFKVYDTMGYVQDEQTMLNMILDYCLAPLYQQAFKWFRKKYSLIGEIFSQLRPSNKFMYGFKIGGSDIIFDGFQTYEEAELECLRKLIEIITNNKSKPPKWL